MIESGIYREGSNPQIDRAIRLHPKLTEFLAQPTVEAASADAVDRQMIELAEGSSR